VPTAMEAGIVNSKMEAAARAEVVAGAGAGAGVGAAGAAGSEVGAGADKWGFVATGTHWTCGVRGASRHLTCW